ncbi:hypothetical protein [Rhizobium fabae]|uniref:Uncharacterized protein n=1 Tax=Rhizobium fabae TaxID=573179 RepID=A0A7W6FJN5_9HYPH|nr:hypothetical protein [Rhizobium fabae]MBB3916250.1 hypothetical protein [Rhizobium fabae]
MLSVDDRSGHRPLETYAFCEDEARLTMPNAVFKITNRNGVHAPADHCQSLLNKNGLGL